MKKLFSYLKLENTLLRIVLFSLFLHISSTAICQSSKWSIVGGINSKTFTQSVDKGIQALVKDQSGNIYAALGKGVYKWDGTGWTELEDYGFVLNPYGDIKAIAVDNAGNVYASADTSFGSSARYYVAKWNGTNWIRLGIDTDIGGYFNLNIRSIATSPSGDLYAAMDGYIYKWDGGQWTMVFSTNFSGYIYSLVFDRNGTLYAAGAFTNTEGKKYVIKWDGTNWVEVGTGINKLNANGTIMSITTDAASYIYAAGAFTNVAGKKYVAKWDGNSWTELGAGGAGINTDANGPILSVAVDAVNNVYVTGVLTNGLGDSYVAKWNGTVWAPLGTGVNGLVNKNYNRVLLIDTVGAVYTQGSRTNAPNIESYIAKWDGTSWTELGSGINVFNCTGLVYRILADTITNSLYTGGDNVDGNNLSHLEKYDGASWTPLPFPGYSNVVTAKIQRDAAGNFYAIGSFNFVRRWDGVNISQFGTSFNGVNSINSLAIDKQDNIYVSAYSASLAKQYVAEWSGTNWVEVGGSGADPFRTTIVGKMIVDNSGNIYAIRSDYINFAYQYNVQKWDGTHWAQLGTLNEDRVIDQLGVDSSGNLYATGQIANNDGLYVAKWDGASWSVLGAPGRNALNQAGNLKAFLVTPSGEIYAGGEFKDVFSRYYMVKWNGTEWVDIGLINSRFRTWVNAIAMDKQGNLYAAGDIKNSRGYNTIIKYQTSITYIFRGNGNWSDAANWSSNTVPPSPLDGGTKIIIDPQLRDGEKKCILDVPVIINNTSSITVNSGGNFIINGNLTINQH